MYGTYSDPEWEPEEWYYKGFPRDEDKNNKYLSDQVFIYFPDSDINDNRPKDNKYEI